MTKVSMLIALLPHLLCTTTAAVINEDTITVTTKTAPSYENDDECGLIGYTNDRLITTGEETLQWPWLAAIYYRPADNVYRYWCAGSLLTTKHVVTAGHCLRISIAENTTNPNNLYVAFGHFSLHQWNESGINREVASYKIHPNYMHSDGSADSDLAILTLKTPIEYSPLIKPICLWSGPTDLQNVVNRAGHVVEWSKESINLEHEERRIIIVPIVSQVDCLRSDRQFFYLTSSNTFCAATRNNSGLCTGTSGNGLMLYDAPTGRYQLRGIASRAPVNNELQCDVTKFVVYVDVAKYVPWIQQQIFAT